MAADITPPRQRLAGVDYFTGDVREPAPAGLENIHSIYNLAATHRTPGHPTHESYEANVLGPANVTSFADANEVLKIVFTSAI